jgi:glyceraldehyde-3-phosphate dehydrogenase/erythrose-4-phosphate dehydrogenase
MALVGSRLVFGAALNNPQAKIVGINDPFIDPEFMAYIPI